MGTELLFADLAGAILDSDATMDCKNGLKHAAGECWQMLAGWVSLEAKVLAAKCQYRVP